MIGRIASLGLIVVFGGVGTFLAAGYGGDDRSLSRTRNHLKVIQDQLAGLKNLLQDYRQTHGRYPTNDQGLAALDNFDARFKIRTAAGVGAWDHDQPAMPIDGDRFFWRLYGQYLKSYREQTGGPPRDGETFGQATGWPWSHERSYPDQEVRILEFDIGITRDDRMFLLSEAGVLSPWHIPYVYENRSGLEPSAFADSPVDRDPDRRFSVAVDDGVYVYSVGGEFYVEQLRQQWWERNLPRFVGAGLIALALVSAVALSLSRVGAAANFIALAISAALGLGGHAASYATCYVPSPLFSYRDSAMVQRQKELLARYRDAGVIGEATYQRAVEAARAGAGRPTTAPEN